MDDLPLAAFLESQPNVGPHLDRPQLALQLPVVRQPAGVERAARFGGDDRAARLLPMPAVRKATAAGQVIDIGERDAERIATGSRPSLPGLATDQSFEPYCAA